MTSSKLGALSAADNAPTIQITKIDDQMSPAALDESIRAQLIHVAVGVGATGSQSARLLVDLSVYLSLEDVDTHMQDKFKRCMLLIPAGSETKVAAQDAEEWERTQTLVPRWSGVCNQVGACGVRSDPVMHPGTGEPLTLRLLFAAFGEREASDMADLLCAHFSARHAATTNLRDAMAAIWTTLLEPQHPRKVTFTRLLYHSASVCLGWREWAGDRTSLLQTSATADSWREPLVTGQVSEFVARRCQAVWYETSRALEAPEPPAEEATAASNDLGKSCDAADDFVCADRMLSLWYGRRRRSTKL